METARDRLHEMEEHIIDGYFSDMILTALPSEYELVRNTSFEAVILDWKTSSLQTRNTYANFLSRSPSVAAHGVAMHV